MALPVNLATVVVSDDLANLFFGGDPALDFANTLEGVRGDPPGTDHLLDYRDVVRWSVRAELLPEAAARRVLRRAANDPAAAAAAHRRAVALRDSAQQVFDALATGRDAPAAALEDIRRRHRDAVARGRLQRGADGRHAWAWDGDALDRPLWPVAVAAVDLLRSPELDRLGACGQCRGVFLDRSRNHSRRWCSMGECGAQIKMRRYRASHGG